MDESGTARALRLVAAVATVVVAIMVVTVSWADSGGGALVVAGVPVLAAAPSLVPRLRRRHAIVATWTAAVVLVVSLYCQQVLGYSGLLSGLVAVPQGVAGILRGVLASRLLERIGIKRFLLLASAVTAAGLFFLFRFPATTHYPGLAIVLFGVGFGTTSLVYGSTVAGSAGVTNDEQGLASALINATRRIGSAVGVAILLSIVASGASGSSSELAASYRTALG